MPETQRARTGATTAGVVETCHELLKWLIPRLDDFPRSRRFTLGVQLEQGVLGLLRLLVEAAYSRDKVPLLQRANRDLEVLRHLWRAGYELQVVAHRQYEHGARLMDDVGRQIGGWLRNPNGYRFRRRFHRLLAHYRAGRLEWGDLMPPVQSWIGHARHAETAGLREAIFGPVAFDSGGWYMV